MSDLETLKAQHPVLTIIRGLPGAGKTTLALALGQPFFEADLYFTDVLKFMEGDTDAYKFDASKLPEAHAWCLSAVKASLESGQDTTVSNTFSRRWEMQPYLDLGFPVRVIEVQGPWKSIHPIPEKSIAAMRARWETVNA